MKIGTMLQPSSLCYAVPSLKRIHFYEARQSAYEAFCGKAAKYEAPQMRYEAKPFQASCFFALKSRQKKWRRERDSNPRYLAVHHISNVAPSTTRPSLRIKQLAYNIARFFQFASVLCKKLSVFCQLAAGTAEFYRAHRKIYRFDKNRQSQDKQHSSGIKYPFRSPVAEYFSA